MAKTKVLTHPPSPPPPGFRFEGVVFVGTFPISSPEYRAMYERATGDEARSLRLQYVSIEAELEAAFRSVAPCEQNADAFSYRFADIIRSACGAFEVFAKALHPRFHQFDPSRDRLDVFNYLALDRHLDLSDYRVDHLLALDQYPGRPELARLFLNVAGWDRASPVQPGHVPGWWDAYNAVKHDLAGVRKAATLGHATAATAALYLLVERVFGFGLLRGGFHHPPSDGGPTAITMAPKWSRLFNHWRPAGGGRPAEGLSLLRQL